MATTTTTKTGGIKPVATKSKSTPYEQEMVTAIKKATEYSLANQANVVSIFYKNSELMYSYQLSLSDFLDNTWKVYWIIAHDIVIKEHKPNLDEVTVGIYLERHNKLRAKYEEYGGYDTVIKAREYVKEENLDGYIRDLNKWNTIVKMLKAGFPVAHRLSELADMSLEDIYETYEAQLNHIFINTDDSIKSYNACDNLHQLIDKLNEGTAIGMPLNNCHILNKEIGGLNLGHIYGLGAATGVGKSTMAINYILPSIIKNDERVLFIINEEETTKVQREMLCWCAANIFKQELPKYILRDGKFNSETMELLRKCADWLEEKKENKNITIIPLEKYSVNIVIKLIKKYKSIGNINFYVLDTLKESYDATTDDIYKSMTRDMVKLYDCIKPSAKNVCLFVTYQLNKASLKQRYYTNSEVGLAKSIVDVMSVNLMMRQPLQEEFDGGKNALTCYRPEGKNGKTKVPFKLIPDKNYMITFICKNRFGISNQYQVVSECNLSTNVHNDLGICYISQDW